MCGQTVCALACRKCWPPIGAGRLAAARRLCRPWRRRAVRNLLRKRGDGAYARHVCVGPRCRQRNPSVNFSCCPVPGRVAVFGSARCEASRRQAAIDFLSRKTLETANAALGLAELHQCVAKVIADAAGSAANSVGKIANEAGKGLLAGFGTPLLIGASLVGLLLIARNRHNDHTEA